MQLRIGELSRRSGVSPELLRAWERRYDLLRPERSSGGLRLYSEEDLERVRAMQRHIAAGVAAREAAVLATQPAPQATAATVFDAQMARAGLRRTLEAFDEPGSQAVFDSLLAVATVDTLLSEVVLPYLREVGERWERGEVSIAQEHFASSLLRGRLLGLARGWGRGGGPRALLACPPGEQHDLGLIAFGLALRERGWRIDYLGTDTPIESIAEAAATIEPELLVVSAVAATPLRRFAGEIAALAPGRIVAVAGAGAGGFDAPGVLTLNGDPIAEADRLSATR
jgi:MerR family transcriptional regulator, light-induced transcriptional regulator